MADPFASYSPGLDSVASHAALVAPSDGADLAPVPRSLLVAVSGDIKVTTLGGETLVLPGVAAGVPIPLRVTRVWSSGTTATGIVAIW